MQKDPLSDLTNRIFLPLKFSGSYPHILYSLLIHWLVFIPCTQWMWHTINPWLFLTHNSPSQKKVLGLESTNSFHNLKSPLVIVGLLHYLDSCQMDFPNSGISIPLQNGFCTKDTFILKRYVAPYKKEWIHKFRQVEHMSTSHVTFCCHWYQYSCSQSSMFWGNHVRNYPELFVNLWMEF